MTRMVEAVKVVTAFALAFAIPLSLLFAAVYVVRLAWRLGGGG